MLVLGRLSIFKGPNFPRAACFSRLQVIAQEPDGWPGQHHPLSGVTSHLWLVVVVTKQMHIYGIVFIFLSIHLMFLNSEVGPLQDQLRVMSHCVHAPVCLSILLLLLKCVRHCGMEPCLATSPPDRLHDPIYVTSIMSNGYVAFSNVKFGPRSLHT